MSQLLNSNKVGILDKSRNSNNHIYDRWKSFGFLEGLDDEIAMKVALAFEIASNILLMEGKMMDIYFKETGNIADDNERVETVIFPVLRRIIGKTPEAHEYVPEILNMTKKEYSTTLCKAVYSGNESAQVYLFEKVLPKWSSWHKDRKHKTYEEYKREKYDQYSERCMRNGRALESYERFAVTDWEAEFCACMAEKIEKTIIEHIKNKEDGE